ncbi:gem-associated protein 5, partial [Nephila pilipes]
ISTKKN